MCVCRGVELNTAAAGHCACQQLRFLPVAVSECCCRHSTSQHEPIIRDMQLLLSYSGIMAGGKEATLYFSPPVIFLFSKFFF